MSIWLTAIGIALVIEGAPYLAFPDGMKRLAARLPEVPDSALRIVGLFAMAAGVALVYFNRPG